MPNSPVCVDASFLLRLLLDDEVGSRADILWETWHRERRRLVTPTLLYYEVANALHRYASHGDLTPDEAEALLDLALRLDIQLIDDAGLHRRAFQLAQALSLPATYDAHYLALAERLGAELWTADQRLLQAVRDSLPWVYRLEESQ
ncbi:type II toxin-antitoxin system VapC family toxin [Thermoflexus sp.]|uniref:type II toxin-antitoxin system VapC family toxin n=1 Tax=Thermoflexus sp. TaxID=1969742 RepID=UPI0026379D44|nr:type II toxin-antitoxin system VapC family toxin [Thermoflexus sp.]MCX7689688.1 type II toxin-antitoxin system VapC family toxin [Thermoflexus sp.]